MSESFTVSAISRESGSKRRRNIECINALYGSIYELL
jgi:hypothetical protein